MITGYNTDVEHEGRVFHVQTEDKGLENPVVESLVYTGGEIVGSRRTSYAELAGTPGCTEAAIQRKMDQQHQAIIREVLSGRFDPEGPKPFGYNIITNRSLDEVVAEFLTQEVGIDQIRLEIEERQILVEGASAVLRLRVLGEGSERPIAGAKVSVKLLSTKDRPKELFAGMTDADGRVEAAVEIPVAPHANCAILCQAEAADNNAEIKQLVRKS
jgi:hypothetical protein